MQSDSGLDLLAYIENEYILKNDLIFNVKEISELVKNYILIKAKELNKGCLKEELDYYIEEYFLNYYADAIILIAEYLVDYFNKKKLVLEFYNYKDNNLYLKEISKIVLSDKDLKHILMELRNIANPDSNKYKSWSESNSFNGMAIAYTNAI